MTGEGSMMPVISKMFCSPSRVVLEVRRRPRVVSGGGLVVTDARSQKLAFRVDGCGVLGKKEEMILNDGDGNSLLLLRQKGGIMEALNIHRQWKGYRYDYEGAQKLVFTLKEPNSFVVKNNPIRISIDQKECSSQCRDLEVKGFFPDRECAIVDFGGNPIAQVGMNKETEQGRESKDLYHVTVNPGIDQAFVIGIIAILDYAYNGSARC